ncbi:hypothetical protein YW90_002267 [Salmonella enterica subsp. enterica]|nr:hypothetical protein [Salmonella enterica subsp. enterica serovar Onderstepoort]EDT6459510.1 hypothetical protein [Salmonella enterica subsp. enterica]
MVSAFLSKTLIDCNKLVKNQTDKYISDAENHQVSFAACYSIDF